MFSANISFSVKKDGEDFVNVSIDYSNMAYENIVMLEGKMLDMLGQLQLEGEKKLASK